MGVLCRVKLFETFLPTSLCSEKQVKDQYSVDLEISILEIGNFHISHGNAKAGTASGLLSQVALHSLTPSDKTWPKNFQIKCVNLGRKVTFFLTKAR
jgi:hypothetical protein